MKILFLTIGNEEIASSRTRVLQYLPYLNNSGIRTRVIIRSPYILHKARNVFERIGQIFHIQFNMLKFFFIAFSYKTLFIQKVYLPKYMSNLYSVLGKKILYDYDDAIYTSFDQKEIKKKKITRLQHALAKADLVIVENDSNKEYSEQYNKNVIIITGPIECNRYKPAPKTDSNKTVIGWIGSPNTTNYLSLVEKPLKQLYKKYPGQFELLLIGASDIIMQGVDIKIQPWSLTTEVALLEKFDIGLMPLFSDPWCLGKGGYKILQYMAMGIPTIASPVGINSILVKHSETGYLADSETDWVNYLEDLILNKDKREKFGTRARQIAQNSYSFEKYSGCLVDEIKKLSENKK